jgi:hypothetical protein
MQRFILSFENDDEIVAMAIGYEYNRNFN